MRYTADPALDYVHLNPIRYLRPVLILGIAVWLNPTSAVKADSHTAEIKWGDVTNKMRMGVKLGQLDGKSRTRCDILLQFVEPTKLRYYLPPSDQIVVAEVKSLTGQTVKKTDEGLRVGRDLSPELTFRDLSHRQVSPNDKPRLIASFYIDELFQIPESGKYEITVGIRLYRPTAKKYLGSVTLPKVRQEFEMKFERQDLH